MLYVHFWALRYNETTDSKCAELKVKLTHKNNQGAKCASYEGKMLLSHSHILSNIV